MKENKREGGRHRGGGDRWRKGGVFVFVVGPRRSQFSEQIREGDSVFARRQGFGRLMETFTRECREGSWRRSVKFAESE